jgi:hypothetical protein
MAEVESLSQLRDFECDLARHERFGDWRQITNRVLTYFHRGVEVLADYMSSAKSFLAAFESATNERRYRVLGDPVVRSAINEGLAWVRSPSSDFPAVTDAILNTASSFLHNGCEISPLEAAASRRIRVGEYPFHQWIWSGEREEDLFGNKFRSLFEREIAQSISSKPAVLRSPDDRMQEVIAMGVRLLQNLLPELARSALAHVHVIAIVDVADRRLWQKETRADLCQNVSTHAIPGTIFLSPSPLRSPWHAAEAIFHEALHKKLSDIVLTRPIFRPGYSAATSPTIRAVWNYPLPWNPNDWSIDRALFAFHVYVHLGLFFRIVEVRSEDLRGEYGSLCGMEPSKAARGAFDRARYLGAQLQRYSEDALGPDGRAFLSWLVTMLQRVDPDPPHDDPTMQLWLDRYDRETREIANLIRKIDNELDGNVTKIGNNSIGAPYDEWSVRRIINHLVHSEIVAAYRVLSILGEENPPSFSFYDGDRWAVLVDSEAPLSELAGLFQALRMFLSSILRNVPAEAFLRQCYTRRMKTLKDIVVDMIEHPQRHIGFLVKRLREQIKRK